MGVHIEIVVGIIRAGEDFNNYGDAYEFSATVLFKNKEAFISGATGKFSKDIFNQLKIMLRELGVDQVFWERKKNGKIKQVSVMI